MKFAILLLPLVVIGCSASEKPFADTIRKQNQVTEYIDRRANEYLFRPSPPKLMAPPSYVWERGDSSILPKITKEFFRCQGSELNPMRTIRKELQDTPVYLHDCGGRDRHGLPERNGQEFIYPILIDLLNHVQVKTGRRVVITSGHRCPVHNKYVDDSPSNSTSKHMVGAAVTFYVQGLEDKPESVVQDLLDYFGENSPFTRDESKKQPSLVSAWIGKEVVIRLYGRHEGRNFDNRHPYPYLSISVRYDRETEKPVSYSWEQAQKYLRW